MKTCENCGNPKSNKTNCTEKCCYEWSMWMPKVLWNLTIPDSGVDKDGKIDFDICKFEDYE